MQTVQYIQPKHHAQLAVAELLVIDEAAAIPLPLVQAMLGPYLVFLCSTVNGYEGWLHRHFPLRTHSRRQLGGCGGGRMGVHHAHDQSHTLALPAATSPSPLPPPAPHLVPQGGMQAIQPGRAGRGAAIFGEPVRRLGRPNDALGQSPTQPKMRTCRQAADDQVGIVTTASVRQAGRRWLW